MGTFFALVAFVALGWAAAFGFQVYLGKQLNQPVNRSTPDHPTIAIQKLVSAASSRGWATELQGSTVVARHGSGAQVCVDVTEADRGSALSGRISGVRHGSVAAVRTHRGGLALLRKREQLISVA